MPGATAVRIADAALEVLGTGGIHALSHARVDASAGLPAGSTSNYFRTRAALVAGATARLRELDAASWQATVEAGAPASVEQVIEAFTAFVEDATGPSRTRTVARYVIFVQGVVEPTLLESLNNDRHLIVDWTTDVLLTLGVPQPAAAAQTLLATVEGLIMHRLTGFSDAPVAAQLSLSFHQLGRAQGAHGGPGAGVPGR